MGFPLLPSSAEVRALLAPLKQAELQRLSSLAGMPFPTISKIRYGEIKNPGLDTVRKFLPHVDAARLPSPAMAGAALSS